MLRIALECKRLYTVRVHMLVFMFVRGTDVQGLAASLFPQMHHGSDLLPWTTCSGLLVSPLGEHFHSFFHYYFSKLPTLQVDRKKGLFICLERSGTM